MLTEQEILDGALERHKICGIYFLIRERNIVYVGQSQDIMARLSTHANGDKLFDSFNFVACDPAELSNLEAEYIVQLNPEYNLKLPINDKWMTLEMLRRYARSLGIGYAAIKKFIESREIRSYSGYYSASDFGEILQGETSK